MNAPATPIATAAPTPAKFVPKVIKQVTQNLLKLRPGITVYILAREKMFESKPLKKQTEENKDKKPPTLLPVINLETGEAESIIVGDVLKDVFADEYPKDAYVGRCFMIAVKDQKASAGGGGRRYNTYNVVEIENPIKGKDTAKAA